MNNISSDLFGDYDLVTNLKMIRIQTIFRSAT